MGSNRLVVDRYISVHYISRSPSSAKAGGGPASFASPPHQRTPPTRNTTGHDRSHRPPVRTAEAVAVLSAMGIEKRGSHP